MERILKMLHKKKSFKDLDFSLLESEIVALCENACDANLHSSYNRKVVKLGNAKYFAYDAKALNSRYRNRGEYRYLFTVNGTKFAGLAVHCNKGGYKWRLR